MKIFVIGAGAWGCAIALHLQRSGSQVTLLVRDEAQLQLLRHDGQNKVRLPGISLQGLPLQTLAGASCAADAVMVALPSHAFAEVIPSLKIEAPLWVSLAKGIVLETLTTPCETLEKLVPEGCEVLSLSGPTHAGSVASGLPCGMVLAGNGHLTALQEALSAKGAMRVYTSDDRRGVEHGGALKNAYAVAAGICDGLRLGDNAKAGLLTRALSEMARLGVSLGGQAETFYGLTGVGDLIATSYGQWSRNRQLGEQVAQGGDAATLVKNGLTAEGYRASIGLHQLAQRKAVEAPILGQVVEILYHKKDPKLALLQLMNRPLKSELNKTK